MSSFDSGPFDIGKEKSASEQQEMSKSVEADWKMNRQQNHSLWNSGMENGLSHCFILGSLHEVFLMVFVTRDSDVRNWDDEFQLSDLLSKEVSRLSLLHGDTSLTCYAVWHLELRYKLYSELKIFFLWAHLLPPFKP